MYSYGIIKDIKREVIPDEALYCSIWNSCSKTLIFEEDF